MFFLVTRFSVFEPSSPQWNLSKDSKTQEDLESYKKLLFNENRLNIRMHIFKDLSLPLINQMSGKHHIIHIVHYSSSLPIKYKNSLLELSKKYSFIRLLETDYETKGIKNDSVNGIMQNELLKINSSTDRLYFGYAMLDDDDLLSVDFLDRMSRYIKPSLVGMWVSFGRGITGYYDVEKKKLSNIRESYLPKINIGFMGVCQFDIKNKVVTLPKHGNHMKKDMYAPVVLDSREISYLWIRHNFQDTLEDKTDFDAKTIKINDNLNSFPLLEEVNILPTQFSTVQFEISQFHLLQKLVKTSLVVDKSMKRFPIKPIQNTFNLSYEIDCVSIEGDKPALVGFRFNSDHPELQKLFALSGNSEIGYFRYLPLENGNNKANIIISLPKGVSLIEVGLRQWGNVAKIELLSLDVSCQTI